MGIERSLRPVAAVSGVGAAGRGRPFGVEELAGGGGRGGGTLLRGNSSSCLPAGLTRALPLGKGTEEREDAVPTRSPLNTQRTAA